MSPLKSAQNPRPLGRRPEQKPLPRERLVEKFKSLGIASVAAAAAMARRQEAR